MQRWTAVLCAAALLTVNGCSDGGDAGGEASEERATTTVGATVDQSPGAGACDPSDPAACLLPWPNDRFTRADSSTSTGRRLDLPADGTPTNASGTHIDPTEWNRNDGFSPASNLVTVVPGLDVERSELPTVGTPGRSLDDDSPLVLVDLDTSERVAAWTELDANMSVADERALLITPVAALAEGHRFAVALRNLVHTDGSEVRRSDGFERLLRRPTDAEEEWLTALDRSGVDRSTLDIAWSFTVASTDSLSGRLRHMASETLERFGDAAPGFTVTSRSEAGPARVVEGTFTMPKYLQGDGSTGSVLNNDDDPNGIPTVDGEMTTDFLCLLPKDGSADDPASMIVYGHGLLGTRNEVRDIGTTASAVGIGMCATDFLGMSAADVPTVVEEFADFSGFRTQPDRMLQGQLAFVLLGRLLRSADGFAKDPAFADASGRPMIDTSKLAFLGASQGGILGGASSSVTNDWDRVVLAVGGLGYNLLLRRSVDFDEFRPALEGSYPSELDQLIVLELAEQLWDRGENAGYAQHLTTDPYDGIEKKQVVALEAFGDHQVTNLATRRLVRTLGLERRSPTLADGRTPLDEPFFGIDELELPSTGSGYYVWDFGTPAPPNDDTPNRGGDDPHGDLGGTPAALALLVSFVQDGKLIDVCPADQPCTG